jgi:hypothetical protein
VREPELPVEHTGQRERLGVRFHLGRLSLWAASANDGFLVSSRPRISSALGELWVSATACLVEAASESMADQRRRALSPRSYARL